MIRRIPFLHVGHVQSGVFSLENEYLYNERSINFLRSISEVLHIPADHEHRFRFNVNTISGPM
ncbi:hypothetical protein WP2S18C03_18840 [Aeromonas veronii]|nr:hypothetical protein WP2S18C03_18840 [Aeromonas veronii]